MALSGKISSDTYKVYTVLGDGEIEEGQVWEAAMFAAHYKLDNLVAVVDNNGLQIDGPISEVNDPSPLDSKFEAFGWNVLVIDGQGGGLGKQLVAALSTQCPEIRLTAVGTNSLAANAMRKAGAPRAATGENAVVVNCRSADIIVGPIGIVVADALLGEITPAMATAVCQSHATRVLIPVNHCENYIVGVPEQPISDLVAAAVQKVKALCAGEGCGKRAY